MKRFLHLCFAAAFLWVVSLFSCGGPRIAEKPAEIVEKPEYTLIVPLERPPVVRVLILESHTSVRVSTTSAFFLGENVQEPPLRKIEKGGDFTVRYSR
ncbi:MAG: hypothetical protein KAX38_05635, partial [Candidatus Krumholzibacteria bacterium]|nr:hypothetical protein [Candidatus Krumholzibacteria bacterium]